MSLLPKTSTDFSSSDYWNSFFKIRGRKAFEWYGEYLELSEHLHKYIKINDEILMIGCGNSTLSADLYDVGFKKIINVDISHIVIKQMKQINQSKRPDMQFIQMDALNMTFEDAKFNVVLDKGTLDALMSDKTDDSLVRANSYFAEIDRVLRLGGRYICITLLQEHILKKIVDHFANTNWMLRIVRCHNAEKSVDDNNDKMILPVFAVIATKFKNIPHMVLEVCLISDKIIRLKNPAEIIDAVNSAQNVAMITHGLSKNSLSEKEEVFLNLFIPGNDNPRYTVRVLDLYSSKNSGRFAVFIVPQGRELDWLFSTPDGRIELIKSAGFNRLAIINLHRDHTYDNLDAVKNELAEYVKNLSPKGTQGQIPFLSLGNDVGKREVIHRGRSAFSGDFVIEEIEDEKSNVMRRLIFLNNQSVVQSESKLKSVKSRNGKKLVVDFGYLACDYHTYMILGAQLALQLNNESASAVIVGLGGGGLCTFLHKCFPKLHITAIDIDSEMLNIAQKYFDFNCDDKLKVFIQDGLRFIREAREKDDKYDIILFDVDNKDVSLGMSCPPQEFVNENVLNDVKYCLNENGFFILNLACRNEKLKSSVIEHLNRTFVNVIAYKLEQDVNEVLYCTNCSKSDWLKELEKASKSINKNAVKSKLVNEDIVDTNTLLKSLKFYL